MHSKSNIVNGILKDSFDGSFIAVYGEEKKYNKQKIVEALRYELQIQNLEIRRELVKKKRIIGEDLVLIVLAAIRNISKEKFKHSRLWATGVKRLQDFIFEFKENIAFKCLDFNYLTDDYSSKFDNLLTKLVTLGLIDQRKKHVAIRTKKEKKLALRFLDRNDYCLNSNGEDFVDNLPLEIQEIGKSLFNSMLKNIEIYCDYLTRDYEITDTLRQRDLRPNLEQKGLPIIDI